MKAHRDVGFFIVLNQPTSSESAVGYKRYLLLKRQDLLGVRTFLFVKTLMRGIALYKTL